MEMSAVSDPETLRVLVGRMRACGIRSLRLDGPNASLRLELGPEARTGEAASATVRAPKTTEVSAPSFGHLRLSGAEQGIDLPEIGARVDKDMILGFVELGDLVLAVRSPRAGRLEAALVADGARIGFGEPLFRLGA